MQATEERVGSRTAPESPAWQALESHYKKIRDRHLRELFAEDPTRGERLTASAAGIELDYSKNRITDETLELLFQQLKEGRVNLNSGFNVSMIPWRAYGNASGGFHRACGQRISAHGAQAASRKAVVFPASATR